ncbi:allantoicase [Streptomyces olivoverticillatus]|uniref:Probable allantoicase n=1 Tax=Streptomyces olivoverticillatus TaxID=66427 RepID=A0A7W7LTG2_9ACTN|nr:allantoicase [Streptomyces olivoverticillatus]MBB4895483.1 allantoicase [Streptomyces olivoverticillatus]
MSTHVISGTPSFNGSFTGDARPYPGGDPYADYRTADFPFTRLPDLADRRLGAAVLAANDEFFAERENLLTPGPARFDPEAFGHKGKIMDGWETRRRRGADACTPHPAAEDHDWALIRLGVPGVVRGVVVDTAHFRGNYPHAVGIEGIRMPGTPSPEELLADGVAWTVLVPRTRIGGHAANGFTVDSAECFTHLRLSQYPDGGIARLRVHGEAAPDPAWLAALGTFDLAALENGGHAEDASDRFYSSPANGIHPGRSRKMDDGWETRRRRDRGHDWVRYRLAGQSVPRAVEIDTGCYKGNAAGWAELWGLDATTGADPGDHTTGWTPLLPRTRLQPDAVHRFTLTGAPAATHVRLDIYPDGGVARLRVHGSLTKEGERRLRGA